MRSSTFEITNSAALERPVGEEKSDGGDGRRYGVGEVEGDDEKYRDLWDEEIRARRAVFGSNAMVRERERERERERDIWEKRVIFVFLKQRKKKVEVLISCLRVPCLWVFVGSGRID
eukprot:TRINITY_DN232_c0_g1_i2.p4 TRINITY_DN232_c0_g1~~TRINITY_DN232_c0_g1_i2.p4  ORF type:complete len:117 (-),score=28.47 TRINITY_DN232_c0_g1_i2:834-1184(-)